VEVTVQDQQFDEWVVAAGPRLHRSAFLLTGDWSTAQDLVQHALVETWTKWGAVEAPDAYARSVMVRAISRWWRRRWRTDIGLEHERTISEADVEPWAALYERDAVLRALLRLPPKQRAVLVLRFYEDLTERQAADALGWPIGTVKSTTSRALSALRDQTGLDRLEAWQ
jgi:RNA polymerase sigma-70 factor (sigma-E family)